MKKILRTSLTSELGVNLIQKTVLDMGCMWYQTGATEAGIDGTIEIVNLETSEATNQIITVQSKATTAFSAETPESVEFVCKDRDLAYWLQGNTPVILVYSRPSTNEAYWVSLKDYFADPMVRATRKIRFSKSTDAFNVGARPRLERIALSKDNGLYLGPQPKFETLYSDLVPVRAFPQKLFTSSTACESRKAVFQKFPRSGERIPQSWTVHGHVVYSFDDLNSKLWEHVCKSGTVEEHETVGWAKTENPATKRVFVELLNLTLRDQLRDQDLLFYEPDRYFYERPDPGLDTKRTQYSSRSKRSSRATFKGYQSSKEPANNLYYRHAGFYANFLRFDQKWFLQITPTYHFTTDGGRISPLAASAMAGIKRLENNQAVHGQVIMWARRLQQQSSGNASPKKMFFAQPLEFESTVGFDDSVWLKHDPTRQEAVDRSALGTVSE